MGYLTQSLKSGSFWYNRNIRISLSGLRIDFSYGVAGIGSPRGHTGIFNGVVRYKRDLEGYTTEVCDPTITVRENATKEPVIFFNLNLSE